MLIAMGLGKESLSREETLVGGFLRGFGRGGSCWMPGGGRNI